MRVLLRRLGRWLFGFPRWPSEHEVVLIQRRARARELLDVRDEVHEQMHVWGEG